jgi:ribosomal-protein-serine acetyltransferase
MPWTADEPRPVGERVELLREFRARFDLGDDFVYGIFDRDERRVLGGTGLHTRAGRDAFEIGYWIRSDSTRRGFATEASAALTRVAFEVCRVDRVEIRVDPANAPSRAIPRKLGYAEEATLRRRLEYPERRDVVLYTLFGDAYPRSAAARVAIEAFDAVGARVL